MKLALQAEKDISLMSRPVRGAWIETAKHQRNSMN